MLSLLSLRCTRSRALPADGSWPLTLGLSLLRRSALLFLLTQVAPQCCDQLGQTCGQLRACRTVRPVTSREERSSCAFGECVCASGLVHLRCRLCMPFPRG